MKKYIKEEDDKTADDKIIHNETGSELSITLYEVQRLEGNK